MLICNLQHKAFSVLRYFGTTQWNLKCYLSFLALCPTFSTLSMLTKRRCNGHENVLVDVRKFWVFFLRLDWACCWRSSARSGGGGVCIRSSDQSLWWPLFLHCCFLAFLTWLRDSGRFCGLLGFQFEVKCVLTRVLQTLFQTLQTEFKSKDAIRLLWKEVCCHKMLMWNKKFHFKFLI